jgi:NTP pyrophosphatase (non-canonical NTP hydrolase)
MHLQARVREFLERHDLSHTPQTHALDLCSEVGEVAKALLEASDYGQVPLSADPALAEELGDVVFSLMALAESLDVNVDQALDGALAKYERRLATKGHSGSGPESPPISDPGE